MGVLVSGKESSVLIDGFHSEYRKDSYLFPSQNVVDSLIYSRFDNPPIKVVLATHFHRDHLDGAQVAKFLEENENAVFAGSNQSVSEVEKTKETFTDRIIPIDTKSYRKQTFNFSDIKVTGFYLDHVSPGRHGSVQNVGYIIEFDGIKIFHSGDSNWFEKAFRELNLKEQEIDLAILPFWMLLSEKNKTDLEKWIAPEQVLATHLPPIGFIQYTSVTDSVFANSISFTSAGNSITIED